jgi:hypothetical protein
MVNGIANKLLKKKTKQKNRIDSHGGTSTYYNPSTQEAQARGSQVSLGYTARPLCLKITKKKNVLGIRILTVKEKKYKYNHKPHSDVSVNIQHIQVVS